MNRPIIPYKGLAYTLLEALRTVRILIDTDKSQDLT